ncbi:MAG: metallophosphoesterase [Thermoplasmata archaeon]|nr:metallophosphoesterase [Thermoplasmata archaeon]
MDSNKTITAHFAQNESETYWAFVIVSDVHTSTNASGTQLNFGQIKEWIDTPTPEMPAPEFMVMTGDFPPVSTATNPSETDDIIDTVFGSDFIWFPIIGNHEIADGIGYFNWCRDTKFPTLPWIVDSGPIGSIGTSYSWEYENAHFISINGYWNGTINSGSDHASDGDVVPALRNWIDSDLSATDKIHKFAFIHEPAYPEHRHVGDSLDKYPANRDAFIMILNNYSVETLFCGHTHFYEHDTSIEYPLLGNVHQLTNAKFQASTGDDGHTITYVLINGTKTTYKIYSANSTTNGYPFTFLEEWTIDLTPPSYSLSVTTLGNGSVTRDPDQTLYPEETLVNLTATANSGWIFSHWSGDLTGNENPVTITMDDDKNIIATFIDVSGTTTTMEDIDSGLPSPTGDYRWKDIANQNYSENYRNNYNYTQANVEVTYYTVESSLHGYLNAMNLKPNFAYQLKLVGTPGTADNERIGLVGRWWQEEWNGTAWANGQNLNNKGDGSSPNPNDNLYFARKDIPDATSPTGLHYRFSGYLVFDYFITDEAGDATFTFEANSSYHVLWKTTQSTQYPRTDLDGPLKSSTFDAGPSSPAYDVEYPLQTVSLFGEWERLPVGGIYLPAGNYSAKIILTEESFHGTGQYDGNWAAAMSANIQCTIVY